MSRRVLTTATLLVMMAFLGLWGTTSVSMPVRAAGGVRQAVPDVKTNPSSSLTIIKEAPDAPPNNQFVFFSDLGDFDLKPGEAQTFTNLPAGDYDVVEDSRSFPDDGIWKLVNLRCQVEGGGWFYPSVYDGGDIFYFIGANISVGAAEHVTCIFLNVRVDEDNSLTIIKEATNAPPDNQFVFFGDLGDFDLKPGEAQTFTNLPDGDYDVVEDGRSFPDEGDWDLLSVRCQVAKGDEFYPEVYNGGDIFYFTGANITLEDTMHVACIFLNEPANIVINQYQLYLPVIIKQ